MKRVLFPVLAVLVLAAGGYLVYGQLTNGQQDSPNKDFSQQDSPDSFEYTEVKGKYMFSGTIVLARAVENEARTATGVDYSQPFSKFGSFKPAQYDGWLADIECPVTTNYIPYQQQVQNTVFNCPPEFLPEMKKYITMANVANNHTADMGDEGYNETVKHLEDAGIQTVGHYDPREKDDICEIMALPVRLQKHDGGEVAGTLPIAFCAWHYFEKDPIPEEIAVMDRYAAVMPVFAFTQVGVEYRDTAEPRQMGIAHQIVDHGPEFLIGNSPHWVQNTEVYKDTLVVYSTGNFIFDQLDEETNRGLSIAVDMTVPYDANVQKWLELGDACQERGDNCLEQAEAQGLKKIMIELDYEPIGSSGGYKQLTQKANPTLQAAIEERTNWQQTISQLR